MPDEWYKQVADCQTSSSVAQYLLFVALITMESLRQARQVTSDQLEYAKPAFMDYMTGQLPTNSNRDYSGLMLKLRDHYLHQ